MKQQDVLSLFRSKSLGEEINRRNVQYSDLQLVRIIYDYAHTYRQRLQMLRDLAASTPSREACELAQMCIQYQTNALTEFKAPKTDAIYELHIQDDPDEYEERYVVRTYEGALRLFDTFHMRYKCTAKEDGRFWIVLRKFVDSNTADDFSEDEAGVCILTKDGEIKMVHVEALNEKECDRQCDSCGRICLDNVDLYFPNFLKTYDAVRYVSCKQINYGISIRLPDDDTDNDAYILPLDSVYTRYKDYKNIHYSHCHIELTRVEKIDADALDDELRKRYDSIVAYLRDNEQ